MAVIAMKTIFGVFVRAHVRVCMRVLERLVVFDDNEADGHRISSELSMPPQTRCSSMGTPRTRACACMRARICSR